MPIEFPGIAATDDGSETTPRSGAGFDKDYPLRLGRPHEDRGWDRVLFAAGSGSPEPAAAAAFLRSPTEKLQVLLAHRPNVSRRLLEIAERGEKFDRALSTPTDVGPSVRPLVREGVAERDAARAAGAAEVSA